MFVRNTKNVEFKKCIECCNSWQHIDINHKLSSEVVQDWTDEIDDLCSIKVHVYV